MKNMIKLVFTIGCFLLSSGAFSQSTYYVKTGTNGTGSSWSDASGDLQAMINQANAGDHVWVAEGIYKPEAMPGATGTLTSRDVSFVLKSGVRIYGGFKGSETELSQRNTSNNVTVLSGDIGTENNNSDNAHHVIVSVKNSAETLLDGFTITDGNANLAGTVQIDGINLTRYSGGGIYMNSSSAVFKNVVIHKNRCSGGEDFYGNGGGIYSFSSQLTIEDAVISENVSERMAGKAGGTSGAIFISGSASARSNINLTNVSIKKNSSMNTVGAVTVSSFTDAEFIDVDFIENKTIGSAGALRVAGANADNFSIFKMNGGSFVKNSATGGGGAVYVWSFTNYHFNNVLFSENETTSGGGAMFLFSGDAAAPNDDVVIANCVFYKNEAKVTGSLGGGAIFVSNNTQAVISGCTFFENHAAFTGAGGGAIGVFGAATVKLDVSNSIFYGNTTAGENEDFYVGSPSTLELSHSITQGQGTDGVNGVKVNVDPQFSSTDPSTNYFLRLLEASPAVDAGDNDKIPQGIDKDLAGNDRIINETVDMGAYEFEDVGGPTLPQTITFAADISKTYGDLKFDPGATTSSDLLVSYSSSNTDVAIVEDGKIIIKAIGTTDLTASQAGNFEYLPADEIIRKLVINKGELTIKPADTSMIQGDQLPQFRIIYDGLVYGETEDVLTSKPVVTTTATSSSAEGDYTLTVSGADAENYSITYETGKLSIVTEYEEGKIRYVKPTASGTGSGLNWENASADLQEMIEASSGGGEVWVAKGTYKPDDLPGSTGTAGGRDVAFVLKSGVGIYGGFTGNEVRRSDRNITDNETILSGDVGIEGTNTDNAYHVVLSVKNTIGTILDGFTITGGNASASGNYVVNGLTIPQNSGGGVFVLDSKEVIFNNLVILKNNVSIASGQGAGLYQESSKTEIRNSVISDNQSQNIGAGFYLIGTATAINEIKFSSIIIRDNKSVKSGAGGYVRYYTDAEFEDVEFENNSGSEGSAIHTAGQLDRKTTIKATRTNFKNHASTGNGGAILAGQYADLELYNCEFTNNSGGSQGGAIYITGNLNLFSKLIVDSCLFSNNKLNSNTANGGAMRIANYVDAWVTNSRFSGNESQGGGAVSLVGSSYAPSENFHLINNIFYNNKSTGTTSGGGAVSTGSYMTANIINCTFYNNEAVNEGGGIRILRSRTLTMNIYNSIFYKNKAITGSDLTYPDDYPTIDFKNNYTQETGTNGVDGVIVGSDPKFESTDPANAKFLHLSILSDAFNSGDNAYIPSDITFDLAGKDRIVYGVVDMGAYEYDGPPLNPTTPQTITFSGDITKTYGDNNFDAAAETNSGLTITYTTSNTAVAVVTSDNKIRLVGAGTVEITANQPGNAQYFPADPVSVILTVNKAPLTIRPNNISVEQGKDFPVFTASYIGLVNDDTEASIAILPTISTTATENSPIGIYPLTASEAQSNKYEFTYEQGELTIIEPVWIPAEKINWEVWFSSSSELQVQVDMITSLNVYLVLYTNIGVPVYKERVELHPGTNKLTIPASRLLPGVYIVNLQGAGLKLDKKIIKR